MQEQPIPMRCQECGRRAGNYFRLVSMTIEGVDYAIEQKDVKFRCGKCQKKFEKRLLAARRVPGEKITVTGWLEEE
jgi:Zn finger protein HypA/HybF involved in hydrogenase expression